VISFPLRPFYPHGNPSSSLSANLVYVRETTGCISGLVAAVMDNRKSVVLAELNIQLFTA
jgi:hypothetical protein